MTKSIEQIKREHALLLESIELTAMPFAVYDNQDRLIAWNQPYEKVHALGFSKLRDRANQRKLYYADLVRVIAEAAVEPAQVEAYVQRRLQEQRNADGTGIDRHYPGAGWFRVTKFKTRGGGVAGFAIDINENKRREAELEQEIRRRVALEEQLRLQANTDSLTQLANRAAFLARGENDLRRAHRYGDDLSVMMMDADLFKQINDVHGHSVGDAVLVKLAQTAVNAVRNVDLVGRMGGEEFAVILVHTKLNEAAACAERIRASIEALEFEGPTGTFRVTASFGVTQRTVDDLSFTGLLDRADRGLYSAKDSGRNRVILC